MSHVRSVRVATACVLMLSATLACAHKTKEAMHKAGQKMKGASEPS